MKINQKLFTLISLLLLANSWAPQSAVTVQENRAEVDFPKEITFHLEATSSSQITDVRLEFGTDALSCGESVSRAIPEDFEPGTAISVEWAWNLRRSGSAPPGTEIWWRWILEDEAGQEIETPVQRLIFLDDFLPWETRESDHLTLSWYEGDEGFAESLLQAGEEALVRLNDLTGVTIEKPVKIFIYASSEDMQDATLFAPDWSGGRAFPWNSTIIIGVPPTNIGYGLDTMAHELSHVVVGYYTFSCVSSTPIWIDEGLAMVTEGDLDPYFEEILQDAIAEDSLLSVREVGQIFSANPDLALQSYVQSYSLVTYLLEDYGSEAMLELLDQYQQGLSEDKALNEVYGFDRDGLEIRWREWLGAAPRQEAPDQESKPTATLIPTLAPIVGPNPQASQTPAELAVSPLTQESDSDPEAAPENGSEQEGDRINPILVIGVMGGSLLVLIVILVVRRKPASQDL